MRLPFPTELPSVLRSMGRGLVPARWRPALAAKLHRLAHLQATNDPLFRASRQKLVALKNSHRGETCVIVGNGPSLATHDLSELDGVTSFCLNRGYLKWIEDGRQPSYAVAVNDLVIEQFHGELNRLECPLFVPWQFHEYFAANPNAIFIEPRWQKQFFGDVSQGLWPGATVTFATMQIAYHLGFRTAILIGVDHHFAQAGTPHLEVVQQSADVDHFVKDYFGEGVRWNLPDLEQSEFAYGLARDAYRADGRSILDATRNGALQLFPKVTLEAALAEARSGAGIPAGSE